MSPAAAMTTRGLQPPSEGRISIQKIVLSNFKKFESIKINFDTELNILAGDNEAGKSSILLAIDLALSGSRSRVETIGVESLIRKRSIEAFLSGEKSVDKLPLLYVEIYLSGIDAPEFHGRRNSLHENAFGLRLTCEPSDDYQQEIRQVLAEKVDNFPFEFYSIKFTTFSGDPYGVFQRPFRHILIDGAQINTDYAQREYTRALYRAHTDPSERGRHENKYRQSKSEFFIEHLKDLNERLPVKFHVRSTTKANLETDLMLVEDGVPIEARGRGRQAMIKTEFALKKGRGPEAIDILLLEEPENHLSHVNMRRLLKGLSKAGKKQLFISTHSSLVCSRLDLRNVIMLDTAGSCASLREIHPETSDFFCKSPDNNVLEFVMSRKVILVEGDADFILISSLYEACTASNLERDGVHVIAVGGTRFKRYLDLAKVLNIRTAIIRDNDGDYQRHCVDNYAGLLSENTRIFSDRDNSRRTFEICIYEDNKSACDNLFGNARRSLTVVDWMLDNKTEAALKLLTSQGSSLQVPEYVREAIAWIRQ